jgi:hypothetical protein
MKRRFFVISKDAFLPENIPKSTSFRSKGSEGSDARRVPKRRVGHGGGGGEGPKGGGSWGGHGVMVG